MDVKTEYYWWNSKVAIKPHDKSNVYNPILEDNCA